MKVKNNPTFILSQKEYNILSEAVNWYDANVDIVEEAGMSDLDLYMIFTTILNQSKIDDNECGDYDEYNDCDDDGDNDDYDDDDDCDDDGCGDCDDFDTERIERIVKATDDWDEIFNKIINGD